MNLFSRAGAVILFLSLGAVIRLGAEVPSGSSSSAVAPVTLPATAVDPAKEAEIRKLLEVTGTMRLVNQMLGQLIAQLRERDPDLPPDFWTQLQKEMDPSRLVEKLIPVYDKYYSLDDLKAVNAFYQTPAGQHLLQTQGEVIKDSQGVAKDWGREAGLKAMLEIQNYKQKMSTTPPSAGNTPQPAPASAPTKPTAQ